MIWRALLLTAGVIIICMAIWLAIGWAIFKIWMVAFT